MSPSGVRAACQNRGTRTTVYSVSGVGMGRSNRELTAYSERLLYRKKKNLQKYSHETVGR